MALPKTFTGGERLFAADLNSNFEDLDTRLSGIDTDDVAEGSVSRYVKRFADASARSTAIPSPAEGMVSYLDDENTVQVYNGTGWTSPVAGLGANVVQTVKTDIFSASVAAGTATDITGLSLSITPTSNTSKVLVMWDLAAFAPSVGWSVLLKRGGSAISVGDASGGLLRVTAFGGSNATNSRETANGAGMVLDSPATTSAVTYQLSIANPASSTNTLLVNRNSSDDRLRAASRITAIEVSA